MRYLLAALLGVLISFNVLADISARNIYFQHLSSQHGLSGEFVNDIVQDGRGHIWIATQSGLNRYDGRNLLVYEHDATNEDSISHNFVRSLHIDHEGELWVATNAGVNRYDYQSDTFERNPLGLPDTLRHLRARDIVQDSRGDFWIGTVDKGVLRVDSKGLTQHYRASKGPGTLPHDNIIDLVEGIDGRIWVGTDGGGLAYFDAHFDGFVTYQNQPGNTASLPSNHIRTLYWDSHGTFWIGTNAGLSRMESNAGVFQSVNINTDTTNASGSQVLAILEDQHGTLWVGTEDGLAEWQYQEQRFIHYREDNSDVNLSNWQVNSLMQDSSGVLWLATNGGVSSWNYISDAFTHYSKENGQLTVDLVTSIAEGEPGTLWIGTYGGGLTKLNQVTGDVEQIKNTTDPSSLSDNKVMSLHVDRAGALWIGTRDSGLNLLLEDGSFRHFQHDVNDSNSLSGNAISTITSAPDGSLWVGVFGGGLNRLDPQTGDIQRFVHQPDVDDSLSSNRVLALLFDRSGHLWIGTEDGGLNEFNPVTETFKHYPLHPSSTDSSKGTAWAMSEDLEGTIWIGTMNQGLLGWSQTHRDEEILQFTRLGISEGVPNSIQGITVGTNNELWASSNRGLFQIDLNTTNVIRYDQRSGLTVSDFLQGASLRGRDGQLYFGSNQGLLAFTPHDLRRNANYPEVHLSARSRHKTLAKTSSSSSSIVDRALDNSDPFIAFDFAALDFVSPENNRYRYILHGFDSSWIPEDKYGRAVYSNLPTGDFVFEVAAANNYGEWNPKTAKMRISVPPPFWKSENAYALYGLIVLIFMGLYVANRRKQRAKDLQMRLNLEKQVQERTLALEEGYSQLQELNKRLAEVSVTDSLTGLRNRRFVDGYLETEIANIKRRRSDQNPDKNESRSSGKSLYFMMIDLDGFKSVNDQYGHNAGDEVLMQVSKTLVNLVREADVVVRWGGDEFMIIGHSSTFTGVKILAERIRETLDEHEFKFQGGSSDNISASIGIAQFPFNESSIEEVSWEQVCRIADRAAYLAKENGRNAWVSLKGEDNFIAQDVSRVATELPKLAAEGKVRIDSALEHDLILDAQDVAAAAG